MCQSLFGAGAFVFLVRQGPRPLRRPPPSAELAGKPKMRKSTTTGGEVDGRGVGFLQMLRTETFQIMGSNLINWASSGGNSIFEFWFSLFWKKCWDVHILKNLEVAS